MTKQAKKTTAPEVLPKWDIRTERTVGTFINPRTGKWGERIVTSVRYRKLGSKGRWQSFIVDGKMPSDHQKLVDAYIKKMADTKARLEDERKTLKRIGPLVTPVSNIESKRRR